MLRGREPPGTMFAMSDIIDRIKGLRYIHVPQASQLFEEAIAEIERLRAKVKLLDAAHSASHSGFMVMASGVENASAEIDRLRLAPDEREAINAMACYFDTKGNIQMQAWGSLLRVILLRNDRLAGT